MPLNRRDFLFAILATPALAAQKKKKQAAPSERPNVMLMVADDLGAYMLGCYGNQEVRTPAIDRLAQTGVRFSYSFASAPSATEGRAAPMGGTPLSPAQAADALTSAVKPFFLTVTLGSPLSLSIPQKNLDLYSTAGFEATGFEPATANATHKEMLRDARVNLRKYAAGITTLDDQVGALMADLQKHGLWESTVTVLTSVHGFLAGRHGLWGDGLASDPLNMYEEVMRVPMIWTWPGHFPPGSVRPDVVGAYDVLATITDVTGAPLATRLCGRSYLPFIYNQRMPKKQPWRGFAFSRFRNVQMARDDRYKLVLREGGPNELFDEATDPGEKVNQYENPQFVSVRDRFTSELKAWRGPCDDTLIELKRAPG